jgi:hypothetical protein
VEAGHDEGVLDGAQHDPGLEAFHREEVLVAMPAVEGHSFQLAGVKVVEDHNFQLVGVMVVEGHSFHLAGVKVVEGHSFHLAAVKTAEYQRASVAPQNYHQVAGLRGMGDPVGLVVVPRSVPVMFGQVDPAEDQYSLQAELIEVVQLPYRQALNNPADAAGVEPCPYQVEAVLSFHRGALEGAFPFQPNLLEGTLPYHLVALEESFRFHRVVPVDWEALVYLLAYQADHLCLEALEEAFPQHPVDLEAPAYRGALADLQVYQQDRQCLEGHLHEGLRKHLGC